jgi:diacylglycerol kinase (ATP)
MTVLFVSNPASGSSDDEVLAAVRDRVEMLGEVRPFVASSAEAYTGELRRAAAGYNSIVIAGGDGSLNHAVNALRDRLDGITFALIPMGTGNDLAETLGLPDDPVEAAEGLKDAEVVELDLGRVTGRGLDRIFVNACVGGFSVAVDESVSEAEKRRLGRFAFWLGGMRAARDISRYRVRVNGLTIDEAVVVGIGNGRTVGGGIELWPNARPDDGILDACVIAAEDLKAGMKAIAKVKTGRHEEGEGVTTLRAGRIEVDADPQMEINIDGELLGLRTPATFETVGIVRVLRPSRGP